MFFCVTHRTDIDLSDSVQSVQFAVMSVVSDEQTQRMTRVQFERDEMKGRFR